MAQAEDDTLPYRADAGDITTLVEARAHGREVDQIKTQFTSRSAFQGALSTASTLGFVLKEKGELTERGRRFALADKENRQNLLLHAILEYEPYDLLLGAVFNREEEDKTTIDWIERWWATHEYGTSETNRNQGSTTFAKLIEYVGLGEYKQGRRGYQTRIEWGSDASSILRHARNRVVQDEEEDSLQQDSLEPKDADSTHQAPVDQTETQEPEGSLSENNALTLNFSNNRVAKLSLPPTLTPSEKKRLVSLVELMVTSTDEPDVTQTEMEL